jgi:gliding motility-associated-like protein
MTPTLPTYLGDAVTSFSISGALPAGLSFNLVTGEISGTPTGIQVAPVEYIITATNIAGSTTTTFILTINDVPPVIAYSPSNVVATKGTAIAVANPVSTGGAVVSYSIAPTLPSGMNFNTTSGQISGAPTVLQTTAVLYTITATNSGGTATAAFSITVNDIPPTSLLYTPATQRATINTAITTMTPSNQGGAVVRYSISPALPAGLSMNTSSGLISGTLIVQLSGTVEYTITATNSGGSTTAKVTIIYNTAPSGLTLSKTNVYETNLVGDLVATMGTVDIDLGDTHAYSLVAGAGSADNRAFTISGNRLLAAQVFDFQAQNSFNIRLRTTDNGGLSFDRMVTIYISELPQVTGQSSFQYNNTISNTPIISKGYSSQLNIAGVGIASVSWSPALGLSATNVLNPVAKPSVTTTYSVTITNSFGSVITLKITVEVKDDYLVTPNNILTPNRDGYNDYWTIQNIESYPDNEILVYDRNGRILHKATAYNNRWEGTSNGKPLATGTYYYIIRFRNNPKAVIKGFISIVNQ